MITEPVITSLFEEDPTCLGKGDDTTILVNIIDKVLLPKQYFPVMLFIMLYKVVLTFEAVYEILK